MGTLSRVMLLGNVRLLVSLTDCCMIFWELSYPLLTDMQGSDSLFTSKFSVAQNLSNCCTRGSWFSFMTSPRPMKLTFRWFSASLLCVIGPMLPLPQSQNRSRRARSTGNWDRACEGSREGERREAKRRLSPFPLPLVLCARSCSSKKRDVWERGRGPWVSRQGVLIWHTLLICCHAFLPIPRRPPERLCQWLVELLSPQCLVTLSQPGAAIV